VVGRRGTAARSRKPFVYRPKRTRPAAGWQRALITFETGFSTRLLEAPGKTQEEINAINTLESSESVPDDLNGNRPTTPDSTRIRVATKEMTAAGDARWWAKPALHLDATVVNYDKVFAKSAWDRANVRLKLAEQDLAQHEKWQGTGEVPAEQVAKARRIVEHAKSVLSSTPGGKKGKKKKGKK